jgi:hypothetical protein
MTTAPHVRAHDAPGRPGPAPRNDDPLLALMASGGAAAT